MLLHSRHITGLAFFVVMHVHAIALVAQKKKKKKLQAHLSSCFCLRWYLFHQWVGSIWSYGLFASLRWRITLIKATPNSFATQLFRYSDSSEQQIVSNLWKLKFEKINERETHLAGLIIIEMLPSRTTFLKVFWK